MAETDHIRNPAEWGVDQLKLASAMLGQAGHSLAGSEESRHVAEPTVRRIGLADLREVLAKGLDAVARAGDLVTALAQHPGERAAQVEIVLHQQDLHRPQGCAQMRPRRPRGSPGGACQPSDMLPPSGFHPPLSRRDALS